MKLEDKLNIIKHFTCLFIFFKLVHNMVKNYKFDFNKFEHRFLS